MKENNIYLISGKNILKFIDLIDDLKELSLDYAEIDFEDLFKTSYSMDEILDKVGLTLKGRK